MPTPAKPIKCHACGGPTLAERSTDGITIRVCKANHKGKYDGLRLVGTVNVRKPRRNPLSVCWCKRRTQYMPTGRLIPVSGGYVYAMKRVCTRGHRSWFRRATDGGAFVRKIDAQKGS